MTEEKRKSAEAAPAAVAHALSPEEVRRLLREGREGRRELDARLERMERVDPKDAAARAR